MADSEYAPPTSIRFPEDLKAALGRRAVADGRKFSQYVLWVLAQHVESTPEPKSPRARK